MRKEAHKKYQHPFIVQADGKLFELYSNTTDERLMWLSGFNYIIKTNEEIKIILKGNNDRNERRKNASSMHLE